MGYYYEGKLCLLKKDYKDLDETFKKHVVSIFDRPVNIFDKYNDKSVYIFSFNNKKELYFKKDLYALKEEFEDMEIPYCFILMGDNTDDITTEGQGELEYALETSRIINLSITREKSSFDILMGLIRNCNEKVFWEYVSQWYDPENILNVMSGWTNDNIDFKAEIEKIETIKKQFESK